MTRTQLSDFHFTPELYKQNSLFLGSEQYDDSKYDVYL